MLTLINTKPKNQYLKTIEIHTNWTNNDSIIQSEETKTNLENMGYKLINHYGGIINTVMIYGKL